MSWFPSSIGGSAKIPKAVSKADKSTDPIEIQEIILEATKQKEKPIKHKHLRNIALNSVGKDGLQIFWNKSYCLKTCYLSYWKYLQLFHSILQNTPSAVAESQSQPVKIFIQERFRTLDLSASTNYASQYSYLFRGYASLLLFKIDFHYDNPNIPGNLQIQQDVFNSMINNVPPDFLLAMLRANLRYWKIIVKFLKDLFNGVAASGNNKLPEASKCKLQPFFLCNEEAKSLYQFSRNILNKLHSEYKDIYSEPENVLFMEICKTQCAICETFETLEWKGEVPDVDFVNDQVLPNEDHNVNSSNTVNTVISSPALMHSSSTVVEVGSRPFPSIIKAFPRTPTITEPSNTYSAQQSCQLPSEMSIQKSRIAEDIKQVESVTNQNGMSEVISILRERVHQMQSQIDLMTAEVGELKMTNDNLTTTNKELLTENQKLENDLKQLKITSGRQFCQLYAALRKKVCEL